jgi:hypothetical protein
MELENIKSLIPEEKQTAAECLIDEILFLKKPLRKCKKKLEWAVMKLGVMLCSVNAIPRLLSGLPNYSL